MSIPDDADFDALIERLSGPLQPGDRAAFRRAAEDILASLVCSGPGAAYRAVSVLQRRYFAPPLGSRATSGARHNHKSKLTDAVPVGADDPRSGGRARRHFAG